MQPYKTPDEMKKAAVGERGRRQAALLVARINFHQIKADKAILRPFLIHLPLSLSLCSLFD